MQKKLISAPHTNHKILHKKPSFEAQLFDVIGYAESIQSSGVFNAKSELSQLSRCSKFKKLSNDQQFILKLALDTIEKPPTDLKAVCEKIGTLPYSLSREEAQQVLNILIKKVSLPNTENNTLDHAEICKDLLFSDHGKHLELTVETLVKQHPEWISSKDNLDKFIQEIFNVVKQDENDVHHFLLPQILPHVFTALRDSVSTENLLEVVQENIRQILSSTAKDKLQLLRILFSVIFESPEPKKELFKSTLEFILNHQEIPREVTKQEILNRLLSCDTENKQLSKEDKWALFYDPKHMPKLDSESRVQLIQTYGLKKIPESPII